MANTELTVKCFNKLKDILKIVEEQNFIVTKKYDMTDLYFTKVDKINIKSMNYSELIGGAILIRSFSNSENALIVHKHKNYDKDGNVISEEKTNVNISKSDVENLKKIFVYAGLTCFADLKQELTIVKNDKIEFCIQEIEGLGTFIEIEEQEYMKGYSTEQKIQELKQVLCSLKLDLDSNFFVKKLEMMLNK